MRRAGPFSIEFDDGHGRLVRRRVFVSIEAANLEALRCWPSLHAVLAVETIRSVNGTVKTVAEWRYYLTSGHDAPEVSGRSDPQALDDREQVCTAAHTMKGRSREN